MCLVQNRTKDCAVESACLSAWCQTLSVQVFKPELKRKCPPVELEGSPKKVLTTRSHFRHSRDTQQLFEVACQSGDANLIEKCLARGVNVDVLQDLDGRTALHLAATEGHTNMAKVLCDFGADTEVLDVDTWTPLHTAAKKGHTGVVQVLLAAGADENSVNHFNQTPLHFACANGHSNVARSLMFAGAIPSKQDISGETPLEYADQEGYSDLVKILGHIGSDRCL
mmetsp:Transcript_3524/g.6675  ORF Transcript_3524/g.6675 Transcript_3524/m.6675 type:complete len:225 (+) Transcript_3524:29-703(+)